MLTYFWALVLWEVAFGRMQGAEGGGSDLYPDNPLIPVCPYLVPRSRENFDQRFYRHVFHYERWRVAYRRRDIPPALSLRRRAQY